VGIFVKEMVDGAVDTVVMPREDSMESSSLVPIPPMAPASSVPSCEAGKGEGEEEDVVFNAVVDIGAADGADVDAALVSVAVGAALVGAAFADAEVGLAPEVALAVNDNIMGFSERYSRKSEVRISKPSV
jgi:hypothetical protein